MRHLKSKPLLEGEGCPRPIHGGLHDVSCSFFQEILQWTPEDVQETAPSFHITLVPPMVKLTALQTHTNPCEPAQQRNQTQSGAKIQMCFTSISIKVCTKMDYSKELTILGHVVA